MNVSVRDLRLHWPAIEKRLRGSGTLTVTRDGKPVASLSAFVDERPLPKARFSAKEQMSWLRKTWRGKKMPRSSDELLAEERADD